MDRSMDLSKKDWEVLKLIWETATANIPLRERLKDEFARRIAANNRYSREYCYSVCRVGKRNMTLYFIPTTAAWERYGESAMVDLLLDDALLSLYETNYAQKISTFGTVLCRPLVPSAFTEEQIRAMATEGFTTSEVYKIVF